MSNLHLPDNITERIQAIANHEQLSVEEVVTRMLQFYPIQTNLQNQAETPTPDPLVGLIGLLNDATQETDMSSTVRETLAKYTHPQYGWTKRDRTD